MNNPLLKTALADYPDVVPESLPWPADAESWELKDLKLFIGSGGFLKPKKKPEAKAAGAAQKAASAVAKVEAAPQKTEQAPREDAEVRKADPATQNSSPGVVKPDVAAPSAAPLCTQNTGQSVSEGISAFERPGWDKERFATTMPVRVHCEDTTPYGHVRLESLVAFSERIRSLSLKDVMNMSLADLKRQKLAILATEYVVEIVGAGCQVLDTLRIYTSVDFPVAPLFPWETSFVADDGSTYAHGRFGLNLCKIADDGSYSGVEESMYRGFAKNFEAWVKPEGSAFSATKMRFFHAYEASGCPFKPTSRKEVSYTVRASDCDLYNILFQARVPSMMQSCHPRYEATAMYVNIRTSVRPGDVLAVHVFANEEEALFVCMKEKACVLTAFGHYGKIKAMKAEGIKCASVRVPLFMKILRGEAASALEDFDLSLL